MFIVTPRMSRRELAALGVARVVPHRPAKLGPKSMLSVAAKKKPARPTHKEHDIQSGYIAWCRGEGERSAPGLARTVAVPNSGGYSGGFASNVNRVKRALASGTAKGFPDTFTPIARGGFFGMLIEFKTQTGRVKPEQSDWLEYLTEQNFYAVVARSTEQAQELALNYMAMPSTKVTR